MPVPTRATPALAAASQPPAPVHTAAFAAPTVPSASLAAAVAAAVAPAALSPAAGASAAISASALAAAAVAAAVAAAALAAARLPVPHRLPDRRQPRERRGAGRRGGRREPRVPRHVRPPRVRLARQRARAVLQLDRLPRLVRARVVLRRPDRVQHRVQHDRVRGGRHPALLVPCVRLQQRVRELVLPAAAAVAAALAAAALAAR